MLIATNVYSQNYATPFSNALEDARTAASMGERVTEDDIFKAVLAAVPPNIREGYTAFKEESKALKQLEVAAGPTPM